MDDLTSRRTFLKTSFTCTLGASFLSLTACSDEPPLLRPQLNLVKDDAAICDLPEGFSYKVLSTFEDKMSDGFTVPDYHDGMGCFAQPDGSHVLVRNHEVSQYFPFDPESPIPQFAYDPKASGGTTTMVVNSALEVTNQFISLTGTIRNCGGGKTPWNTWISCEEVSDGIWRNGTWEMGERHGYNFEVDPLAPLQKALPLKSMGRFKHEAVAFDSIHNAIYQTEDNLDGCFYRFIPSNPLKLDQGGKLQALKFTDPQITHTSIDALKLNQAYPCEWVTIDDPDPEENNVALQARQKGAAIFVRGEGIVADTNSIVFACSYGGVNQLGQFFRYSPNTDGQTGTISLIYESKEADALANPDNITLNKWGDLIICEDGPSHEKCLVGLKPNGQLYYIAATTISEWAGACFSDDDETLFVNIHRPGKTLAIRGPWGKLRDT